MLPRQAQSAPAQRRPSPYCRIRSSKYHACRVVEALRSFDGSWRDFRWPGQTKLRTNPQSKYLATPQHVQRLINQGARSYLLGDFLNLYAPCGCDDKLPRADRSLRLSADPVSCRQAESVSLSLPSDWEIGWILGSIQPRSVVKLVDTAIRTNRRISIQECCQHQRRRCKQWFGVGKLCNFDQFVPGLLSLVRSKLAPHARCHCLATPNDHWESQLRKQQNHGGSICALWSRASYHGARGS